MKTTRAPRLDFPFWEDERRTVRFSVDGGYDRNREGELVFHKVRWRDTWLYTLKPPNNHVPISLLPAPLLILGVELQESMIYQRHVIFALPSFAILLGAGMEGLFAWLRSPRKAATATVAVMLTYLGSHAWLSRVVHAALRSLPIQQTREVVLMTRPSLDPFAKENLDIVTVS